MSFQANPELHWLTLIVFATALMWLPHILQLTTQEGLVQAVRDPARETAHKALWAQRARRAHANAIENLVIFAPLVILIVLTDKGSEQTVLASMVFFIARIGHFLAYALAIPYARVILFFVGWACQMFLAAALFGWM